MKVKVKLTNFEEEIELAEKPKSIEDLADRITDELARKYAEKLGKGEKKRINSLYWSYYDSHYDAIYQLLLDRLEKLKEEKYGRK